MNAFLSIASKAAALALLVRVAIGFGAIPPEARHTQQVASAEIGSRGLFAVADDEHPKEDTAKSNGDAAHGHSEGEAPHAVSGTPNENLAGSRFFMAKLIAFLAAITCTFGNLAAYGQTNIKRLLAYSTIAHAGYMMMAVPAMLVMAGDAPLRAQAAVSALAIYIGIYLFMNLGVFAIVAFLRNALRTEEIADYAGLIRRCPFTVVCFVLILFSLVGLPPLAGFIGKFAIFASLAEGWTVSGYTAHFLIVLLVVGGMNTAISLFYYLRIARVMVIEDEPADRQPFVYPEVSLQGAFVCLLTAPAVLLIFDWETLSQWAQAATQYLLVAA